MKKQALKQMQDDLINLVIKYYSDNKEIKELIKSINTRKEELRKQREKRIQAIKNAQKNKKIAITINSLEICEKLLRKEILSNEIMGIDQNIGELQETQDEIINAIFKNEVNNNGKK